MTSNDLIAKYRQTPFVYEKHEINAAVVLIAHTTGDSVKLAELIAHLIHEANNKNHGRKD